MKKSQIQSQKCEVKEEELKIKMKITKQKLKDIVNEELETLLNEKCWDGYEKKGMKTMFGKRVPNCVKKTNEGEDVRDTYGDEVVKQNEKDRKEGAKKLLQLEDGHEDVPSARRAMQTIIEDAGQMLQALDQMQGNLPTWWTNKMAVAASSLNKMRDYLLVDSEE